MLSAAIDRIKGLLGSESRSDDGRTAEGDECEDSPDLYECEGCGAVFISRPNRCSNCDDDDFSNVGTFK